jgi:hypothetical protein
MEAVSVEQTKPKLNKKAVEMATQDPWFELKL